MVNVTSRVVSNRETTTSIILDESEPFQEAFNMCLILGRVNSKSYYPPAALTKLPIPINVQLKKGKDNSHVGTAKQAWLDSADPMIRRREKNIHFLTAWMKDEIKSAQYTLQRHALWDVGCLSIRRKV